MALAVALVLIVAAAVLFHLLSPWWMTPIASNWGLLDDTLWITLVITGIAFVAINGFVAYAIYKYRHREGHKAAYEPHNSKLEWRLTIITTIGIVAMLAPGLWVYAEMITPPKDSLAVEVVGKQWQWRFRFPGKDGQLGTSDARFVTAENPFGLNPKDPRGKDDILVDGQELHIPLDTPIKILQRSQDVLHDFDVPQMRVKMDMVPGLVSEFWFKPTKPGRYEIMCAEFCGVAHYNMRGYLVVEHKDLFNKWLETQPTYQQAQAKAAQSAGATGGEALVAKGRELAQARGCVACHSIDGAPSVGPTWKGLAGKTETLTTGAKVTVDDAYLKKSILEPAADVVQGFPPVMPPMPLSDPEVAAVIAYIKDVSSK